MADNPSEVWNALFKFGGVEGLPYVPSSYMLYSLLVNSAGLDTEMAGVDVTSGTKQTFGYACPSGHNAAILRVNINIVDNVMTPTKFAGFSAFPNGLAIEHLSSVVGSREVIKEFTDNHFIKKNADWSFLAGVNGIVIAAAGDDFLPVRWTIDKMGTPLHLAENEMFAFSFQDSTTGITDMDAMVQGLVFPNQLGVG